MIPLSTGYFNDPEEARLHLEKIRWPEGPVCPQCGAAGGKGLARAGNSKTHARKGLYQCAVCRRQFSVTVGTLLEDAHTPLQKWLLAIYLACSEKEGVSALQLQRVLDLGGYRTAWMMCHRIRWALQRPPMPQMIKISPSARRLRIALPWDQALRGLLNVAQQPRDSFRSDRKTGAKMERRQRIG